MAETRVLVSHLGPLCGHFEMPRPTSVSVDLLDLKPSWLTWCAAQGVQPSVALRDAIRALMGQEGALPRLHSSPPAESPFSGLGSPQPAPDLI